MSQFSISEMTTFRWTFDEDVHHFAAAGTDDPLGKMLYVDTRFYLPGDMLVKVDRMSMAHSLEGLSSPTSTVSYNTPRTSGPGARSAML